MIHLLENRKNRIAIWGAGKMFHIVYEAIIKEKADIISVIDNNVKEIMGIATMPSDIIDQLDIDWLIISVKRSQSIIDECMRLGFPIEKIIDFWGNSEKAGLAECGQDFINLYVRENYNLKIENDILKCRNENYKYEYLYDDTPIIRSSEDLLDILIKSGKSLTRLGDGEFEIIFGRNRAWFQEKQEELSDKLKSALDSEDDKLIVAIADNYGSLEKYTDKAADAIRKYMCAARTDHERIIQRDKIYYDAYVTRPYLIYKDKTRSKMIFEKWKELFANKNILIVEGEFSGFGIGNELLDNVKSIKRILCPSTNAFSVYGEIVERVGEYIENNLDSIELVLVTLGPTATCLVYDLCRIGVQIIDIGQLDNEYCWYKMGVDYQAEIPGKLVVESGNKSAKRVECDKTVIMRIGV